MMLAIKAICKSENNEEVVIIGFELEGYCLCMTKSGTIFHAKHENLTIVDKEYMKSCAKESIDFEMADFLEKASAKLDQIQIKQLTSIILELQEYRSKIPEGSVVLSEEEWANSITIDVFIEKVKKTCKETAERFAIAVKENSETEYIYGAKCHKHYSISEDDLNEICKYFTEGKV